MLRRQTAKYKIVFSINSRIHIQKLRMEPFNVTEGA